MKEHSHLDAWLQFAEQAVSCPDLSNFTYITAKEELRKFEVSLVSARSLFLGWAKFRAETKSETRLCWPHSNNLQWVKILYRRLNKDRAVLLLMRSDHKVRLKYHSLLPHYFEVKQENQ